MNHSFVDVAKEFHLLVEGRPYRPQTISATTISVTAISATEIDHIGHTSATRNVHMRRRKVQTDHPSSSRGQGNRSEDAEAVRDETATSSKGQTTHLQHQLWKIWNE